MLNEEDTIFWKAAIFISRNEIKGDYLEFGVFKGHSFVKAYKAFRRAFNSHTRWESERDFGTRRKLWKGMRFIAFDSFKGLPEATGIDTKTDLFYGGKYSNSKENFLKYIKGEGIQEGRVEIIQGWFEETLNNKTIGKYNLNHAAIVHIDSDLYESAKTVLDFIGPLLVDGSIIIFDNWFTYNGNPNFGEQKAFREWSDF